MKQYKKLEEKYTHQEIAESYIFPDEATNEQRAKGLDLFQAFRMKKMEKQTVEEKLIVQVLQLKFLMEDYIRGNEYNNRLNFGFFLKEYVTALEIKNKDFADDIGITPTELSHYISNRRKPTDELIIRLEIHSNENIPAIYWYKILEKENEYEIATDMAIRKHEQKKVKNKLEFSL